MKTNANWKFPLPVWRVKEILELVFSSESFQKISKNLKMRLFDTVEWWAYWNKNIN